MPEATHPANPPSGDPAARRRKFGRQKRFVAVLGVLLIVVGVVVLIALRRVPPPLRIMAGLGDIFMGCFLLVLVWQARRK